MDYNKILYDKMGELDAKIAKLILEKGKLEKEKLFDKDLSFLVIEYLISLMEGKNYKICKVPIELYSYIDKSGDFEIVKCWLVCLIESEKIDYVTEQIKNMFPIRRRFVSSKDWNRNCRNLLVANDDYIQLVCYVEGDSREIFYTSDNDIINNRRSGFYSKKFIVSNICDERYLYIVDFMDNVVGYKLSMDSEVSFDEMKDMALKYVNECKKIGMKRQRNKNSVI